MPGDCGQCGGTGVREGDICQYCMGSGRRPDPSKIVRPTDPSTSHEAAFTVDLKGDRLLAYNAMRAHERDHPEGFSRAEIAEIIVLGHVHPEGRAQRARIESIRRRVSDFVDVVEETGAKRGTEALLRLKR